MHWLLTFLLSFSIAVLLMPMFIRLMEKYRFLDVAGGRKIHKGYTAHMGGVVIFIGFIASFIFSIVEVAYLIPIVNIVSLFIIFAFILILGVRDDMNSLSPFIKLIFEIIIGLCFCAIDIRLKSFSGFLGIGTLPVWLSYVLTIFFFIVVSNAYNLIDGIDGQAALQAIATFGAICIFLWKLLPVSVYGVNGIETSWFWLMLIAALLGSITGFLYYNWQNAKIFMGDTGSLFIGFMTGISIIATMNISTSYSASIFDYPIRSNLGVILSFFFLPLADTLRVFILRIRKGRSPLYPDKTHIHHLLLRLKNYSHAKCAITLFLLQIGIMILMLFLSLFFNDNIFAIIIFFVWLIYVAAVKFLIQNQIKSNR